VPTWAQKIIQYKMQNCWSLSEIYFLFANIRALKYHGGQALNDLTNENLSTLEKGLPNLERHIENLNNFGIPVVVAVHLFKSHSQEEQDLIIAHCHKQ
jgi:formate--tetrahydrofolate ligase